MARIVLLHATPVAMEPIQRAMRTLWPEAEAVNLLDDALSIDREREGSELSERSIGRFLELGTYAAESIRAEGILATCSAFGAALDHLASTLSIPVVKPNEPMFTDALRVGNKVAMLATFAPAVPSMEAEFYHLAPHACLDTIVVEGAIEALRAGHADAHNRMVAEAASYLTEYDAVMLAHFSTSRALSLVSQVTSLPVLAAPEAAVTRMRQLIEGHDTTMPGVIG